MDGSPTLNKRREARRFNPPEGNENLQRKIAKPIRAVEESTRREHGSAKLYYLSRGTTPSSTNNRPFRSLRRRSAFGQLSVAARNIYLEDRRAGIDFVFE